MIETLELAYIAQVAAFAALKNLRKNSYEIFSKIRKTNPIFPHFSPENNDSTKKQTQFKPNSNPNKANLVNSLRGKIMSKSPGIKRQNLVFTALCAIILRSLKKLLLLRERAKFSPARRKVKIATGIAKAMSRTHFGLTTSPVEIAAVRSKNEFLEVPLVGIDFEKASYCVRKHIIDFEVGTYEKDTVFSSFGRSFNN